MNIDIMTINPHNARQVQYKRIPSFDSLKIAVIDIETTGLEPSTSEIIAVGIKCGDSVTIFENKGNEANLLKRVLNYLDMIRLDVLAGYNFFDFDIPYIIAKCNQYGISCGFVVSEHEQAVAKTLIAGRPVKFKPIYHRNFNLIDAMFLAMRYDFTARELTSYTLKDVALELGLRNKRRLELSHRQIKRLYENGELAKIKEYLIYDLEDTLAIVKQLLPIEYYQLKYLPENTSLQYATVCGNATKWNMILKEYYGYEPQPDTKYKYEGAYVMASPHLYKNVAKVDVSSLYPSIMLGYSVWTRKDPEKFGLDLLSHLKEHKEKNKKRAKAGDVEASRLAGAQKEFINSAYGFLGTANKGFNDMNSAELVTAYGRKIVKFMVDIIEREGGIVAEVDTDGIIFSHPNPHKITQVLNSELPEIINVELEFTAPYGYIEAKKNYIIFDDNLEPIIIKGVKFRGRDRCPLEKRFAVEYVKSYITGAPENYWSNLERNLINYQVDLTDLMIKRRVGRGDRKLLMLGDVGELVEFYFGGSGKLAVPTKEGRYNVHEYYARLKRLKDKIDEVCKGGVIGE